MRRWRTAWTMAAAMGLWSLGSTAAQAEERAPPVLDDPEPASERNLAFLRSAAERCFPGDEEAQARFSPELIGLGEINACLARIGEPTLAGGAGGMPIRIGAAPFQVQIRYAAGVLLRKPWSDYLARGWKPWEVRHICGGALIEQQWVLTAAHCIDAAKLRDGVEVVLGNDDISAPRGTALTVDRFVRHGAYRSGNMYDHDIALLHIAGGRAIDPNARTIAVDTPVQAQARAADAGLAVNGWGKASNLRQQPVAVLRRFWMRQVSNCAELPGYTGGRIGPRVFCAGGPNVKICQGDSGGPLYTAPRGGAPVLVGVVSWNKPACTTLDARRPGVYTKVAAYSGAAWIERAKNARGDRVR